MFVLTVSEPVTLPCKINLPFLVVEEISSTVSHHGVTACLSGFQAQGILQHLYMCTGGKELNVCGVAQGVCLLLSGSISKGPSRSGF